MRKTIKVVAGLLACTWLSWMSPAHAQMTAHAAVALSATLPSSVALSESVIPVSIVVTNGGQSATAVTASVKWNLNPREAQGFRVLASLVGKGLENQPNSAPAAVSSTDIEGGLVGSDFRSFAEKNRSVVLMHVAVSASNRQGQQKTTLQFKINDDRLATLPDGVYTGWVKLEAQIL